MEFKRKSIRRNSGIRIKTIELKELEREVPEDIICESPDIKQIVKRKMLGESYLEKIKKALVN